MEWPCEHPEAAEPEVCPTSCLTAREGFKFCLRYGLIKKKKKGGRREAKRKANSEHTAEPYLGGARRYDKPFSFTWKPLHELD